MPSSKATPSVGRPPSPPRLHTERSNMTAKAAPRAALAKPRSTPVKASKAQTTLVPVEFGKRSSTNHGFKGRAKVIPNGNIITFFKKAEELSTRIFVPDRGVNNTTHMALEDEDGDWEDNEFHDVRSENVEDRFNENEGSSKRQKLVEDVSTRDKGPTTLADASLLTTKSPPVEIMTPSLPARRKTGPFLDDSDSEADEVGMPTTLHRCDPPIEAADPEDTLQVNEAHIVADDKLEHGSALDTMPPLLRKESTSQLAQEDFEEFHGLEDDDVLEGEEYDERRWMEEQRRLEMADDGVEDYDDREPPDLFPEVGQGEHQEGEPKCEGPHCPLCNASLKGLGDQEASVHVNACLDGTPLTTTSESPTPKPESPLLLSHGSKMFKKPPRPAKPGQKTPFQLGETGQHTAETKSAFSRLMANHVEDAAWANAAAAENKARGKPAYERMCPFYKIMPGFYICVDAFRYGAVKGQKAYFLSHFHSDHYIGLTTSWSHGPIYCSKVTANLVRQQLRVDPKWVIDLDFEKRTEVTGTEGVSVTMISANHCPGSSLFLFEKEINKPNSPKLQRVLHCGDFRACQEHLKHPLLKPEVLDAVSGKSRQQKLDVCYLDTTYLNPKYAFPPQQQVIQACADMCVSLNKVRADEQDGWEQMKRKRAGEGMVNFVRKPSDVKSEQGNGDEHIDAMAIVKSGPSKERGRLLVIVGTYSIGKERICIGIAKALNSKIYAPPNKQKICKALEDPELNALLTKNPREAQVHMTPLFEIRADTLEDYLHDYRDEFSRAVGFRPSGWNYRPPNSRFTESPLVQNVLHSQNWKSQFSMKDLTAQRGSTSRASCFGVPYSEHSSFRELTMFCCALRIDKIIPTVNVGSAKSREKMKGWCDKWAGDKRKNGLFRLGSGEGEGVW
ncbi:DNA cross-link repair protein pso2/snm1 [Amniculicola lignicola CBS 123094]|uniref:DNA cross-link repair protein pso2/snm1 n=1 Tax=Amniculicola lignicola CBS 123094 TaxID=1392246 RepID=A0A6A5WEB9_9PLEO|nr:DNA cross-link repair protein pso2/snm1 [Amniculicola lignicola CBS 123094]